MMENSYKMRPEHKKSADVGRETITSFGGGLSFVMRMLGLLLLIFSVGPVCAQNTEKMVVTTGTTTSYEGQNYAYILWQPGDISATLGKRFAIYSKTGQLNSSATYARLGIQTLQTNPETIRALLHLGEKIDFSAGTLNHRINGLYQDTVIGMEEPNSPDDTLNVARKLSYLISAAVEDPQLLNQLLFLGRAHSGVMQALGHGFAIPISGNGVRTFEVREIDLNDQDIRVIGRVELNPAAPFVAPVPGPPVQVRFPRVQAKYEESPKNHLNARFRWGLSNTLRRAMPETFGFDLYRVRESVAVDLGWHTAAPTRAQMIAALQGTAGHQQGDIAQINELPILIDSALTLAEAADVNDTETSYLHDDNWLAQGGVPFQDGETFYYYVAARDVIGRPGNISPGLRVVMCDRLPPLPPRISAVENVFTDHPTTTELAAQEGDQRLKVRIRQLDDSIPGEAAGRYFVYRWKNPREVLTANGAPEVSRVGIVDHVPGEGFVEFIDTGVDAPSMPGDAGITYWYTVRAEGITSCDPKNLSAHSAPQYGVLRDRTGPPAPGGDITVCNYLPGVSYEGQEGSAIGNWDLDSEYDGFVVRVSRDSKKIVSAEVMVDEVLEKGEFRFRESRTVMFGAGEDKNLLFRFRPEGFLRISVRVQTSVGKLSDWQMREIAVDPSVGNVVVLKFLGSVVRDCESLAIGFTGSPAIHEPLLPDGTITGVSGNVDLPPNAFEWRVYRRIGHDGPQTLIASDSGIGISSPAPWEDDAVPAAPGTTICYYYQVLDQNGNASPRILVKCVTMAGQAMPVPMLSEAVLKADANNDLYAVLSWFCDPVGVERFELLVAADANADPEVSGVAISSRLQDASDDSPGATTLPVEVDGELLHAAIYQTVRVGAAGFGDGPNFSINVRVPSDQRLAFAVRAVGEGAFPERQSGGLSNVVQAEWVVPGGGPSGVIPWPARPLPSLYRGATPVSQFQPKTGPYYATRLPAHLGAAGGVLMGVYGSEAHETLVLKGREHVWLTKHADPLDGFFRQNAQGIADKEGTESAVPFVVYRYQVPNTKFPNVVPNLVQVSPMIDRLTWDDTHNDFTTVHDPFFRFPSITGSGVALPVAGNVGGDEVPITAVIDNAAIRPVYLEKVQNLILWIDPMPYIRDASYRYLIVRFDPVTKEISRVIPTNPVHPSEP